MERHELSAAFGTLGAADSDDLRDSLVKHGLMEPIIIYEGLILDGWHRYQLADANDVELRFEQLSPDMDPRDFVIAKNAARRHLTQSQKAAAVVRVHEWKPAHRESGEGDDSTKTVEEMADQAGVSERTIQRAKKAEEGGLGDQVIDGSMSASEAAEQVDDKPVAKKQTAKQKQQAELSELRETVAAQAEELEGERMLRKGYELEVQDNPDEIKLELRNLTAQVRTLNGQLGQAQTKLKDCEAAGKRKDARIRELEKQVKDLTDEVESADEQLTSEPVFTQEETIDGDDLFED